MQDIHRIIIFFLLSLLGSSISAQLGTNFQSITVDDGLAQNSVWDVIQDSRGYLWIATADGLNRFDGYSFKHYKHKPGDSTTIGGITIFGFFIDKYETLWVSHDRGISIYDRNRDHFSNLDLKAGVVLGEGGDAIWTVNNQSEIVKVDYNGNVMKTFEMKLGIGSLGSAKKAIRTPTHLFATTQFGFLKIDFWNDKITLIDAPLSFKGAILSLNDSLIFHPGSSSFVYNIRSNSFRKVETGLVMDEHLITTAIQFYRGRIILGCVLGVFELDTITLKVLRHIRSFEKGKREGFRYVQSFYEDRSGNLFIGTNGDGMKVHTPDKNKFELYSTGETTTDMIKAIGLMNGKLVTGLFDHGMVIYDDFSLYEHVEFIKNGKTTSVLALSKYDESRLILVNDRDLVIYNLANRKEEVRIPYSKRLEIPYPVLFKNENGHWSYNSVNSIFEINDSFVSKRIYYHSSAANISYFTLIRGELWVGTTNGLTITDDKRNVKKQLLDNYYIKSFIKANNHVWVATTSGIFELTDAGEIIRRHDVSTGLPNDFVYGVLQDDLGFIWISHNKGLTRIDPSSSEYLNFGLGDGLQSNEFNTGAFFKDEDGYLYFGGVKGVNKIDPTKIDRAELPIQIAINQINLRDEPLKTDTSYNEMKTVVLDYNNNTISFDFSALDFRASENIGYAYQLDGYDPQWIESGNKHFARYANLPSGEFTFRIRAAFENGAWSNPRSIRVSIATPYWQAWWFILLLVLAGISILVFVGYAFVQRQKAKLKQELDLQHKLELERIRISRDLHDHVGAQLSYLITNMEWMAEHPDQIDADYRREQLKVLSEAGRQAVTTLRQTIWAISQQELSVEEFADRFKQFALKMVEFNPRMTVKFEEVLDENYPLSPSVALNLFRICQEAFNNALKHSEGSHLLVKFIGTPENPFQFQLKDDGMGFDYEAASQNGHYGLRNMKARAQECGATLEIETEVGAGTSVSLGLTHKK